MRFKSKTTFNSHDTHKVRSADGRTNIAHGVEKRCDAVVKLFSKYRRPKTPHEVLVMMRKIEADGGGKETYSSSDIEYVLARLVDAQVLDRPAKSKYCLADGGAALWKAMEKTTV